MLRAHVYALVGADDKRWLTPRKSFGASNRPEGYTLRAGCTNRKHDYQKANRRRQPHAADCSTRHRMLVSMLIRPRPLLLLHEKIQPGSRDLLEAVKVDAKSDTLNSVRGCSRPVLIPPFVWDESTEILIER